MEYKKTNKRKKGPYDPIKVDKMNKKWAEEMRKDGVRIIENWRPDQGTIVTVIKSKENK